MQRIWKILVYLSCFIITIMLTSCNHKEQNNGVTILKLAVFEDNSLLQQQVVSFNKENTDFQIQIKKYEDLGVYGSEAISTLKREIMTADGPDIISFGSLYSNSAVTGNYLEDLLPIMETDSDFQKENYFTNIVDSYRIGEKLYVIPADFTLQTMLGLTSELGSKSSWNIKEIMECYDTKKNEMILYPGETKSDVFGTICSASMEHYINWETGECKFDSEEFKNLLEFCNQFPDKLQIADDFSAKSSFQDRKALLFPTTISSVYSMAVSRSVFGDNEVTYIGYPMDEVNGTIINSADITLGISATSKNKSAAWQFIKQFLEKDFQQNIEDALPIDKEIMSQRIKQAKDIDYKEDEQGNKTALPKENVSFEGEEDVPVYNINEQDGEKLLELIETASINGAYDYELYNILLEEVSSYFAGEKSSEEVIANIQNRVSIYVKEKIG